VQLTTDCKPYLEAVEAFGMDLHDNVDFARSSPVGGV
jgi:hypothetical protein